MKRATPYLLAALVLVAGFIGIHQVNVTWDEAVGDLFFGQRYASFFASFDWRYLDFRADPYPPGFQPDLRASPLRLRPWEHYPVASTLATATSRLFVALKLFDPFDGYHAFNIILATLFLILFYRFVEDGADTVAAVTATLLLFFAPRVVADTLGNVKDYAEMVFFAAALIALWRAVERERLGLLIASGVVAGLALGTKANALFLPPVAILYIVLRGRRRLWLLPWLGVMIGVFFVSWPYLWIHPAEGLWQNAIYVLLRGTDTKVTANANPFAMIAFTTPPTFLIAFALGLLPLARRLRVREPFALLVACWIGVVAARLALPGTVNFDGVRHFLELFPPVAAVGGMGVASLGRWRKLAAAAAVAPVIIALAFVHPFESAYWNGIVGGLDGAIRRHEPQAGDYWAASYRLGLRWLDANAPPDTLLAVPIAEHTVRIVAPYRLRRDIHLVHLTNAWSPDIDLRTLAALRQVSAQRPVYVMTVLREEWANQLVYDTLNGLPQLQVWQVDGAPVLAICRLTPAPADDRRP
jgi:hypothetical protein